LFAPKVFAQLDYIHYVPPVYSGSSVDADVGRNVVVITTDSRDLIDVDIFLGGSATAFKTVQVSKSAPYEHVFETPAGNFYSDIINYPLVYDFPRGLVGANELNKILPDAGVKFRSYDAPIYVNIRHVSAIHGASLTTKGRFAMGQEFRSGHLYTDGMNSLNKRSHFLSVMATEDGTSVKLTNINIGILSDFTLPGYSKSILPTDTIRVTLNEGESYVIGVDHDLAAFNSGLRNDMNGTHILSDKDIVVNTGSWTSGPSRGQDIGIDQIVPYSEIRDKYVVMKGLGDNTTERPIVVATVDGTDIYVNGESSPVNPTPLNKGEYYAIPATKYFLDNSIYTMNIDTKDKNVYVYQTMTGSASQIGPTVGMNFIAPLSATGMHQVDIPFADYLAQKKVTSVITILAQKGATLQYENTISGVTTTREMLPSEAADIPGNNEWVSYKLVNVIGDIRFQSSRALNVAWTVQSGYIGSAGYYSGFSKAIPKIITEVKIETALDVICESYNENIEVGIQATPVPDFYEWYKNEVLEANLLFENEKLIVPAPDVPTKYIVVAYFRDPSLDILYNGDFSSGRGNFETDYTIVDGNLRNPGEFALTFTPKSENTAFEDFDDMEGGGLMFLAQSNVPGDTVYQKLDIPIEREYNYILKVHGRMAKVGSPQLLDIYINDEKIKSNFLLDDLTTWQSVTSLWKSKDNQKATISLVDANAGGNTGVFAIDSITFIPAVEDTGEFNAIVIPNYSFTPYDKPQHFCLGQSGLIDISNGETSWYDYVWERKLGEGNYVPIAESNVIGLDTYKLEFSNVTNDNAGVYRCTITFKEGFEQCGATVDPAQLEVEVVIDELARITSLDGASDICGGESVALEVNVEGKYSRVAWSVNGVEKAEGKIFDFNLDKSFGEGVYTIRCDVENACAPLSQEVEIEIFGKPNLTDLQVPIGLCDQNLVNLTAVGSTPVGATMEYSWYRDDALIETNNLSVFPVLPSMTDSYYKVGVAARYNIAGLDEHTCVGNELTEILAANAVYPQIILVPLAAVDLCEGESHLYKAELTTLGDYYTYLWETPPVIVGDKTTVDLSLIGITPAMAGNYKVTVTNRCGTENTTSVLSVTPKMNVTDITIDNDGPYCDGDPVTITVDALNADYYKAENITVGQEQTFNPIISPFLLTANTANEGIWEITAVGNCGTTYQEPFTIDILENFSDPAMNNITTCFGEDVRFEVQIETIPSGSDLTYAWTVPVGSSAVDSGTAILDVSNVLVGDLGDYTCVVTNKCSISKNVTATLSAESVITALTASIVEVCQGTVNYSFDIVTVGTPEFSWKFNDPNGVEIGTGSSYVIPSVELVNAGIYYCDITLECGTVVKYQRELVVNDHISVSEDPSVVLDICEGEQTELIINVTGTPNSIKWFDDTNTEMPAYAGETRISTGLLTPAKTYNFRYELTGDCENPTGDFDVIVHDKPSINPIVDINDCNGNNIPLSMTVVGTDLIQESWLNPDNSLLANGLTATITGATYPTSSGNYTAKVTTDYCGDFTTIAKVNVYKPIAVLSNSDTAPKPCIGEPLSLVVTGDGDGLSYKWTKGGVDQGVQPIPNILDLGAADLSDDGNYKCELISTNGCTNEFVDFVVNVREHAKITLQPVALTPCQNDAPVTFTVAGTAEDTPKYQWYNNAGLITNGGDYSGATSTDLTVSNLLGNDGDSYYCEVSGDYCDPIESEKASLTVNRNIAITKDPVDVTIAQDGIATFTVEAEGTKPFTYNWYEVSAPLVSLGNTSTLTINPASIGLNGNEYKCKVSNTCSTDIESAKAKLTVDAFLKITSQPSDVVKCVGDNYQFVVSFINTATNCVWEYDDGGGFVSTTTNPKMSTSAFDPNSPNTLSVIGATAIMDGWKFRAIVSGLTPDDTSEEAEVKVDVPASFNAIADKAICNGNGVGFTVDGLSGSTPFTYDWKRGGVSIGTNSSLNLIAANAIDGGYSVDVTSGVCPEESKTFNISHYADLVLDNLAHTTPLCPTDDIDLTAVLSSGPAISAIYTWTKDGVDLGEASNNYKDLIITTAEEGLYKVAVEDICMTKSKSIYIDVLDIITKASPDWLNETLCVGEDLSLEASVTGDNPTYTWTVPAGVADPGNVSTLNINGVAEVNEGKYTCDIVGSCGTASYSVDIVINDVPNITTDLNLSAECEGDPLVLGAIAYDATTGESIKWILPNGSTSPVTALELDLGIAEIAEEGNYKVEVTNACGSDFSIGYQDVHSLPTLTPIANQTACQGENVIVRAVTTGENLTYRWFVDGAPQVAFDDKSELEIPNIQPTTPNTNRIYNVECRVSSCGTDLSEIANVTVNPNTILNTSIKGEVVYVGSPHVFDLDITGSNLTFEWHHIQTDATDVTLLETTKTLTIASLLPVHAGEYYCIITGDCGVRFTSGYLTVKDPMKVVTDLNSLADIEKCDGEPLNLNISVEGDVFSIKWFKDGVDLSHDELNYSIPALDAASDAGSYSCVIIGEGANITETVNVFVYQNTVLNSDLKDKVLCEHENLSWIPDVSGSVLTYDWKFGLTTVSTDKELINADVLVDTAGLYVVDVIGKCGSVTTQANLTVKRLPQFISRSADLETCENDAEAIFNVTYTGDDLLYQWQKDGVDIAGANSTELKIQNLRVGDAGVYTCVVSSSCGISADNPAMNLVVIPQLKILSESSDLEICDGEDAQFIIEVDGNDVVYQWKKDGLNIPGEMAPELIINPASLADNGFYSCAVTDKCTTTERYSNSKELTVNGLPSSQIFGRMNLCVLEDRVAYNTSLTNYRYGWLVNGGEFTTPAEGYGTKITWGDVVAGSNVKIMITNEATGCVSEVDSLVTLHPLPEVNLTALKTRGICDSLFDLSGGFPTGGIYWVDGVAQNTFAPKEKGNGEYNVRYSYTDNLGCSNTTSELVMKIDSLPIVKIVEDVIVGSCETKQLSAITEEDNIRWSPGLYLDDRDSENPIFTAGETTLYVATVVDKHGCVGNDIINVAVAPLPLITTIKDTIIGECKEIQLTTIISGDIDEITWTNASDLDNSNNSNPKLINRQVGVNDYQINVTDKYGCVALGSVQVEVLPNPEIGEDQNLCEGETLLIDTKDLSNPVWSDDATYRGSDDYTEGERTINKPGEYELTVAQNDCELIQKIVMNPLPKFKLDNTVQPGIVIFEGQTVTLEPDLNPDYSPFVYDWSDGSVLPQLEVSESGVYKLKVEDNLGCIATDTVEVLVKPIGIEAPNAFTPNGTPRSQNNYFFLKDINVTDKFDMYIYNRWGELLYKTSEPGESGGWDGTYKGANCPVGTYVWVVFLDGKMKEKGTVTLLR
tara:strand:- start:22564 stop:32487 length:9924 start_codon:yes stop_codon:yes gene_type:complete